MDLSYQRERLFELAEEGAYIGTSSWKYPGWCGIVYAEQRYRTRGRFSEAKFNRECLSEYAETYRTVCVDGAYYQFPTAQYLGALCEQVPEGFKFAFKATDEVTVRKFPNLPRFGARAGTVNPNFLNAEMFSRLFLGPCEGVRSKIGPIIFEFSSFHKTDFEHGRDFAGALDRFLGQLPSGWEFGVEMRNKAWLVSDYFSMLRSRGIAHVLNNWSRMPSVAEQMALEGIETADFSVSRFLLKPGRSYEASVKASQPYSEIREPNDEARGAMRKLLEGSLVRKRRCYIYVNNRLEGCAPTTIGNVLQQMAESKPGLEIRDDAP